MKTRLIFLSLAFGLWCSTAAGQSHFQMQLFVGSGGGSSSSGLYRANVTIGEPIVGADSSSGYRHGLGFWHQYQGIEELLANSFVVLDGWNMASVPKTVADYRKTTLYPMATSPAYAYVGGYQTQDTLGNGPGYWLKFSGNQLVYYPGGLTSRETIMVVDKWNMIGSIGTPVQTSAVGSEPAGIVASQYFGYDHGYFPISSRETIMVVDKWNMIGSIGTPVQTSAVGSEPAGIVASQYFGYDHGYFP